MALNLYLDKKTDINNLTTFLSGIAGVDEITVSLDNSLFKLDNENALKSFLASLRNINHLLNSMNIAINLAVDNVCTGGMSATEDYRRRLLTFLKKIEKMGICVILSEPMLIDFVLKNFKDLKVIIYARSSHGILDFHIRCCFYTKVMGEQGNINRIILPSDLNRNFESIKIIRNLTDCEISLVANEGDVFCSPFRISELCSLSHISASDDQGYYTKVEKIYQSKRNEIFLKNPWRLIASPWIRPDDIDFYEKLGVNSFTILASNNLEGSRKMVQAYLERRYDRNLLDILKYGESLRNKISINNAAFNGFVRRVFAAKGCTADCSVCRVCMETKGIERV